MPWKPILFVLASSLVVIGLFLFISSSFSSALIKISTTEKSIDLDDLVFLSKNGSSGSIEYDLMKLEASASAKIPVTGTKKVNRSATGRATIYNMYSSAIQKLVMDTRLETKDGKIYRIQNPVSIPGLSIIDGKVVPGSVNVSIKASMPGSQYNIPPSEFTIPGFKNSPKYEKFYAKSSENISGGFSGEVKTSSPEDVEKTQKKLEGSLKQELTKKVLDQTPRGFLLYSDAVFFSSKDNLLDGFSLVSATGTEAHLKITETLRAIIIENKKFEDFIISKKILKLNDDKLGIKIIVPDIDKISFKILDKDKVNLDKEESNILVRISGKISAIYDFDDNELRNKLAGTRKSEYQTILKDFSTIERAEAIFSPSWTLYFPGDIKRITIDKGVHLNNKSLDSE